MTPSSSPIVCPLQINGSIHQCPVIVFHDHHAKGRFGQPVVIVRRKVEDTMLAHKPLFLLEVVPYCGLVITYCRQARPQPALEHPIHVPRMNLNGSLYLAV